MERGNENAIDGGEFGHPCSRRIRSRMEGRAFKKEKWDWVKGRRQEERRKNKEKILL